MGKIFTDYFAFATLSSAHKWPRLAALGSGKLGQERLELPFNKVQYEIQELCAEWSLNS